MDVWVSFWSALTNVIPSSGLGAVAAVVLLRSAAVPIPIPADLLVVMVGVQAREQELVLWPAWIVLAASTTIGAALLYAFVRWIAQGDVTRYGRYVGFSAERLNVAEERVAKRGARAIFVARIIPGLRMAIVAVCGMMRFRAWTFLVAVICGALLYVGACLTIGYVFGPAIGEVVGVLVFPLGLAEPLIGLGLLLFWLIRARTRMQRSAAEKPLTRSSRARVGALSGALAIAGSTMLGNALVYVVLPIVVSPQQGSASLEGLASWSGELGSFLQMYVDSIAAGIILGLTYAVVGIHWGLENWPDWLHGLSFAALAFVFVLFLQVLALARLTPPLTTWPTVVLAEAIRWAAYGVLLGLIYPVLHIRQRQAEAETRNMVGAFGG